MMTLMTMNSHAADRTGDHGNLEEEPSKSKSVCIVETSTGSSQELLNLCKQMMPGVKVYQVIDDSLLPEMIANGRLTKDVSQRFLNCYLQAESLGVNAILHQCVVGGDIPFLVEPFIKTPIVRIDEGMMHKALETGSNIAVFAFVDMALACSCSLLQKTADQEGKTIRIDRHLLSKAADIRAEVTKAAQDNDVIILAQPSMTALLPQLQHIGKPVLTAPELGVAYLNQRVNEK